MTLCVRIGSVIGEGRQLSAPGFPNFFSFVQMMRQSNSSEIPCYCHSERSEKSAGVQKKNSRFLVASLLGMTSVQAKSASRRNQTRTADSSSPRSSDDKDIGGMARTQDKGLGGMTGAHDKGTGGMTGAQE